MKITGAVAILAEGLLFALLLQALLQNASSDLHEGGIIVQSYISEIGGEKRSDKGLQKAFDAKDSVGGIVECKVSGLPVGLGEPFLTLQNH